MKVCLINESFPPVIDGVANVLLNYADHLIDDHNSQFTDILVSATAHTMEEKEHYRRLRHEIFNDFRETAVGMMENIEDVTAEVKLDFREAKAELKEAGTELKATGTEFLHQIHSLLDLPDRKA